MREFRLILGKSEAESGVPIQREPFSVPKIAYENPEVLNFDHNAGEAWSKSVTV